MIESPVHTDRDLATMTLRRSMGRKAGWLGLGATPALYFTTTSTFIGSFIEDKLFPQVHIQDYSSVLATLTCLSGLAFVGGWTYVASTWQPEKSMIAEVGTPFAGEVKKSNKVRGFNTAVGVSALVAPVVGTFIPPLAPAAGLYTTITGLTWGIRKAYQLSVAHGVNKHARQIKRGH